MTDDHNTDPLSQTQADGTRQDQDDASREEATSFESPAAVQQKPARAVPAHEATPEEPKSRSRGAPVLFLALGVALVLGSSAMVLRMTRSAAARLAAPEAVDRPQVAVADHAEVAYCTPQFKEVLERVLHACGLEGGTSRRGCQPSDVKSLASISDGDFNALFTPLKDRGAVLLFDNASHELDAGAKALLEEKWLDRKGARYFFVVARASKIGAKDRNRALSHRRANSVKFHVGSLAEDPDLDRKVGQLWLGSEFGQLNDEFCTWPNSRKDQTCNEEVINRSVFVSWVDCRL